MKNITTDTEINYLKSLVLYMVKTFYPENFDNFELCEDIYSLLTQIDNMLTGLERKNNQN